jgi:multiple sugar transport system substrate-binding protein
MHKQATLKGITWGHSRGYTPVVACAQRFSELHPHINITWHKRTLQEFADFPIEQLVHDYDLLIIDHPWVGCAAATGCVLPLEKYLPAHYLNDQLRNSVGSSHISYNYNNHQWALAIDAATPVASYRKDLLEQHDSALPQNWQQLIALAAKGKVAVPAIPIDLLMNFYMLCIALGKAPFNNKEEVIDFNTGIAALEMMKELWSLVDERMFSCNPIAVAELMSKTNDYWYCPFAYGYSNYARRGYAKYQLHYTDIIGMHNAADKMHSTLGGTGLAISAFSDKKLEALLFAEWIVSPETQIGLYTQTGGQPGYLSAWTDADNNAATMNYFSETLPALQRAYMRPRYNGYLYFQDHAGLPVQQYLLGNIKSSEALSEINTLYRLSFKG